MFILLLILIFLVVNIVILVKISRKIKTHIIYVNEILKVIDENIFDIKETLDFWDKLGCEFLETDEDLEDEEE